MQIKQIINSIIKIISISFNGYIKIIYHNLINIYAYITIIASLSFFYMKMDHDSRNSARFATIIVLILFNGITKFLDEVFDYLEIFPYQDLQNTKRDKIIKIIIYFIYIFLSLILFLLVIFSILFLLHLVSN